MGMAGTGAAFEDMDALEGEQRDHRSSTLWAEEPRSPAFSEAEGCIPAHYESSSGSAKRKILSLHICICSENC